MSKPGTQLVILTDLDGTLLSHETYQPGPSLEALRTCSSSGIPVIFVSSKTRPEIEELRDALGNEDPFISENGGGIYLPQKTWNEAPGFKKERGYWSLALGSPYPELCRGLDAAAKRCSAQVEGFSSMTLERIMELTGLPEKQARLSQAREFDEPFLVLNENAQVLKCLAKEIRNAGFQLTRGGRFYHIMGDCDKGKAVRHVIRLYRIINPDVRFAAVGDSENDLPMLQEADHPFLVRQPNNAYEKTAVSPGVTVTDGIGPQGFYEAVQKIINDNNS
jgi:mannosyl-3-phosphoglycerate phosphatase